MAERIRMTEGLRNQIRDDVLSGRSSLMSIQPLGTEETNDVLSLVFEIKGEGIAPPQEVCPPARRTKFTHSPPVILWKNGVCLTNQQPQA
jgi:hypothetical protein